ncbi:MAG: hypothetical protein GY861_16775, partial [bacterium]|nr:hypothetical protein [bacterium]
MRVCIDKKSGKLIESQSGNDESKLNALKENAIQAGYKETGIELSIVTDDVFKVLLEAAAPEKTYA